MNTPSRLTAQKEVVQKTPTQGEPGWREMRKGRIAKAVMAASRSSRGKSVGAKSGNLSSLIKDVTQGLPYSSLSTLHKQTKLPLECIVKIAQVSPRTLARRKKAGRFVQIESERLLRLGLVFEKTLELFEGDLEATNRWLISPAKALGGVTPLDMLQTEIGAREVEDLIGRLEHGVIS